MIGLALLGLAFADPIAIGIEEGPLRPGRAVQVTVGSVLPGMPALEVEGGAVRLDADGDGWRRYTVVPDGGPLRLRAGPVERTLSVEVTPPSSLVVPKRVDGAIGADAIEVVVGGQGVSVDVLDVVLSEGSLADVQDGEDGVHLWVEPESSPFPRVVMVGVRDRRTDDAPAWVPIRLRARPRLPLVAEPGAELRVTVGERSYGPFLADDAGRIEATIDQYPGELVARAVLVDDLGNETRTDMPLPILREQRLFGMVAGERLPGMRPPTLHLVAFRDDGGPNPPGAPLCRTPDADLAVVSAVGHGWAAPLPAIWSDDDLTDLRVSCQFAGTEHSERVDLPDGVPHALRLRTFPDEVRADFPEADLRVVLEDLRGDRLRPDGVEVSAEQGLVTLRPVQGNVLLGTYDGHEAVEPGNDVLVARLSEKLGEGPVQGVAGGWARDNGTLELFGRAVDSRGRPLRGVDLALQLDDEAVGAGPTGADGLFALSARDGGGAIRILRVEGGPWWTEELLFPESRGGVGPGQARLEARQGLGVRAGTLAGISVVVDPPLLRAAPGAVAWVYVTLEDRSGLPLRDARLRVEASEGEVGELKQRGDGSWVAEYLPATGGSVRDVVLTAESEGVRSSTTLAVEPRVVRMSLGPWVGGVSNFGEVGTWTGGVDLDVRLRNRIVGEAAMVRVGAWGYGVSSTITGDGELSLRGSVAPVHLALLLRQDAGRWGLWGGAGGAVALHRLELRAGQDIISEGYRGLGGPVVFGGVGTRFLGGEALVEVRGLWLDGPVGEVGWTGNLGGLAAGLGWRVLY